jgi:ATP-dependent DNA helicase RecG
MVNIGMIDTLGYGIHSMVMAQRKRFFPLPDYVLTEPQKVSLQIYGHSIDENYSKLLIERKDLPLTCVVLLDRVQKKLPITDDAAVMLKRDKLIAGRKPNFYVEASIAAAADNKASYIKNRAFDDGHYKDMVIKYLKTYKKANRNDIDVLLLDKLSDILNDKQKRNKIRNLLYAMSKKEGLIMNSVKTTRHPIWVLNENNDANKLDSEDKG